MAIGQDLLDIPFADLVRNLAFAIAEGQLALDRSSIETLKFLIDPTNSVPIVPEIAEIIEPITREVEFGSDTPKKKIAYSGTNITASGAAPITLSLLQAGLTPTFYQFTEATIEVKLSVSMRQTENRESGGRTSTAVPVKGYLTRAFASPVNYRTANTYSYTADGSTVLRVTMRPVPAPARLMPRIVTVNAFTTPPTVTVTE